MNDHPLSLDHSQLSSEELENRLTQLNKKWHTARRMNMDPQVMHQLDLLLQGLEYEKQRRHTQTDHTSGVVIDTDGQDAKKT
jgi:hypothetical protein